jgi:hypothetical protein
MLRLTNNFSKKTTENFRRYFANSAHTIQLKYNFTEIIIAQLKRL